MTPEEIGRIKRLCEQATPGPWMVEGGTDLVWGECAAGDVSSYGMGYPIMAGTSALGRWARGFPRMGQREANSAFIAAARTDLPALLEALEASQARVRRLEEALATIEGRHVGCIRQTARAALQEGKT